MVNSSAPLPRSTRARRAPRAAFTFDIVHTVDDPWVERDSFVVECACGIASGISHATLDAALHEYMHTCPNRTRPVFSGVVR